MNQPNLPAHLINRRTTGALDDVSSGLGTSQPPYVSIKGSRFTIVDAAGTKQNVGGFDQTIGQFIDVIILAGNKNVSQIYYEGDFDPGAVEFQPPDCWSDNGVAPSVNASRPQSATCASCPKREWGSDVSKVSGRGIPACGQYKKLALMFADPDVAGDMVFLMRVPPNSIKPLRAYAKKVAQARIGERALDFTDLVTRIYFDVGPQRNQLGTLGFQAVEYIDAETMEVVDKIVADTASLDIILNRNDRPRISVLGAPATTGGTGPAMTEAQFGGQATAIGQLNAGGLGQITVDRGRVSFPGEAPKPPQTAPAPPQVAPAPLGAGPEDGAAPKRGPGRPRKSRAATVAPSPAQQAGLRAPFEPAPPENAPAPAPQAPGGIVQGAQPPDAEMAQQLNALFRNGK